MTGITRDAGFPESAAQLMAMLNQCCEGYNVYEVLQAVANLQGAAINAYATADKMDDRARVLFREEVLAQTRELADRNWNREPQPSDVPVKSS